MADSLAINILLGLLGLYAIAWVYLRATQDSREPPTIDSSIPFISPLIALVAKGPTYFSSRGNVPFYTLRLPGQRLYIVNSTALIPLVNRKAHAPTISFEPILIKVAKGLMGFSDGGIAIIEHAPQDGSHGLLEVSAKNTRVSLTPGPNLLALDGRVTSQIQTALAPMMSESKGQSVNLYEWLTRTITKISTETIYGPLNPLRDPANVQAWQDVGVGFVPLLVNILPNLVAGKSVKARQRLVDGFKKYYEQKGYEHPDTSLLIRNRQAIFAERGMSNSDMARHEVAATLALLINTIPATFWFIYHVFADPEALEDCRRELAEGIRSDGKGGRSIDLAFIKTSCPTLLSTFKETLRYHGINVAPRVITEDTLVDGRFLLKKGGVLLIPATVQHSLAAVWGEDVNEFQYKRFARDPNGKNQRLYDPSAFRVFGGGSVICPGRYFATTEILALAAMMILQFDVRPSAGKWTMPTVEKSNPAISFQQPDTDVALDLIPRKEPMCEIAVGGAWDRVETSLAKEFNVE